MDSTAPSTKITFGEIKTHRPDLAHVTTRCWNRWASRPVRGVKLQVTRIGGRLFTSLEFVDQFLAALNAPVEASRAK